jgi:hypothetical protein
MSETTKTFVVLFAAALVLLVVLVATYTTSERFRAFVRYGTDLEQTDLGGWNALHRASARGDVEMIGYLLEAGVDKNARTVRGETAWHIAEQLGRSEAARHLEEAGVERSEAELPEIAGPYLGQEMPGDTPELFMPGVVSGHYPAHSSCVFSPDLTTVYWTAGVPPHGGVEVMRVEGPAYTWSWPELTEMTGEPSFSPDGKKLFFLSRDPLEPGMPGDEENLWVSEKTAEGWSDPRPLSDKVNSKNPHFHHSVDRYGNLYFSDYNTLYYSEFRDGQYQEAVDLAVLTGNDTLKGNSPYVTPGADVLLFSAQRGLRGKELFVSFRREDGGWSERISLGPEVNAGRLNDSPRLTPAGNFLFFVSAGNGRAWGIYWVSASFLDRLKAAHMGMETPPSNIVALRGSTPRIDGVFSEGEWEDAEIVELTATKKMFVKHDGEHLFLALNSVGGNVFFHRGEQVQILHASFALGRAEYRSEGDSWSFDYKTDTQLHGLESRPAEEIDAEVARHIEKNGWVASLIPMGGPYEIEYAVSFNWLGIELGEGESATIELPRMATRHMAGPPHLRPTWPPEVNLVDWLDTGTVEFEVETWGRISAAP